MAYCFFFVCFFFDASFKNNVVQPKHFFKPAVFSNVCTSAHTYSHVMGVSNCSTENDTWNEMTDLIKSYLTDINVLSWSKLLNELFIWFWFWFWLGSSSSSVRWFPETKAQQQHQRQIHAHTHHTCAHIHLFIYNTIKTQAFSLALNYKHF